MDYLLTIDQGTTSSRTILFDAQGQIVDLAQQEFPQYYPQSGWVEHDAIEIWASQKRTIEEVLGRHQGKIAHIAAIGITNQSTM